MYVTNHTKWLSQNHININCRQSYWIIGKIISTFEPQIPSKPDVGVLELSYRWSPKNHISLRCVFFGHPVVFRIAHNASGFWQMTGMETDNPYTLVPWNGRVLACLLHFSLFRPCQSMRRTWAGVCYCYCFVISWWFAWTRDGNRIFLNWIFNY